MAPPRRDRLRAVAGAYLRLAPYARPHRGTLAAAFGLTLVMIVAEAVRPWPVKLVLDQVILGQEMRGLPAWLHGPDGSIRLLWVSCAGLLVVAVVGGLAEYRRTVAVARAGNRIVAQVRSDLHDRLIRMSMGFHAGHRRGDLLVRLTGDAATLSTLLIEGIVLLGQELLMAVGIAAVALALNARLAAIAIVTMPLVTLIVLHYGRRLRTAARKQRRKEGEIATGAAESLLAVPEIQAYGLEERAGAFFAKQARKSGRASVAAARLEGRMARATDVSIAFGTGVVLLAGAQQVLAGRLTPGEMLVFVSYVRALFKPMRRIATRTAKLVKASAGGERILDILDARPELGDPPRPAEIGAVRGDVRFWRVRYAYPGADVEALCEVDLHVRAGEHVALLGPNGSGKSTLTSMIPRLRDPDTGRVLLDGHDVRSFALAALRRRVAVVFQRTVLFDGTIAENVRMGRPDATDAELREAMDLAGVTEVAAALPHGTDTRVGEIGEALSGGQRQRVALARALLRAAPVTVFDEPTSALDPDAVERLLSVVLPSLRGRTVLLVTHDRRLARRADRAVVMHAGRVVFTGPPAEALDLAHRSEAAPAAAPLLERRA